MGGIAAKYLPDCYQFEEPELLKISQAAINSQDCESAETKPPHFMGCAQIYHPSDGMCALRGASFTCTDSCRERCPQG